MKSAHVVSFAIGSLFALGAAALAIESCTTGESVNGNPGTAGTSGSAGTTGTGTGTAGTTGTSTGTAGTTGTSTGTAGTTGTSTGTAGTTGTSTGTAGTTGTATGTAGTTGTSTGTAGTTGAAGSGASGTAGSTGSAGTTGSAGATGAGGAWPPTPNCTGLMTAAGGAPGKGGTCTASDPQVCYKTCGPSSIGYKSEMCMTGMYAEMDGCNFDPSADYTCYKIPATPDPTCPTTAPPKASSSCTGVTMCAVCNMGGMYQDSSGAMKSGYCVCPSGASPKWTCAATNAWPCPGHTGC